MSLEQIPERCTGTLPPLARRRLVAWLSLPDGDRAELLDGRIVYKAMSSLEHGDAVMGIAGQLDRFRGRGGGGGGGWWLSQDVDMYLGGQGVRPDLVGWRVDRHPKPPQKVNLGEHLGVYVTPPDWVCEVLSASTRTRDEEDGAKWRAYHQAGVTHYWLVDLGREQITVYGRGEGAYEPVDIAGRHAVKPLAPFEGVEFVAGRVFVMVQALKEG